LQTEVDVLRDANRATLGLVRISHQQRELLEDKYNAYLEEIDDGSIVLKKKIKSKDEKSKTLQETIVDRLTTELHGAFNSIVMSLQSE
jgi:hypothetical protein